MRILVAGTFIYPQGAAGRATQMQARGLAEAGHHVTVVMARGDNVEKRISRDGFTVKTFGAVEEGQGRLAGPLRWAMAQLGVLAYLLVSVLGRRFDCVMFYGVAPIFALVALVARLWRQRTCLIQYDLMKTGVFVSFWNYLYRQLIIGSEIILARCSSLVIIGYATALEGVFTHIAPRTPRVKVWPPTDTAQFGSGNAARARSHLGLTDCPLVVYAGAIGRLEGIDVLLNAMSEVAQQCPNIKLVLAGPVLQYDYMDGRPVNYENMVQDLGLGGTVLFTGVLPTEQLVDLLAAANCLVMPKVDHPSNAAASPIKVGEYLASGRPVVASRVCELDTWLRHGEDVWFCAPGDQGDLATAIVRLLTDKHLAQKLQANGQRAAYDMCDYRAWVQRVEEALRLTERHSGFKN